MPGLRIHHPEARSCVVLVPIPAKSAKGQPTELQLVLDDEGNALVSEGVWAELDLAREAGLPHKFLIVGHVENPPPLMLGPAVQQAPDRDTYRQERDFLRQVAPAGVNAVVVEKGIRQNIVGRS